MTRTKKKTTFNGPGVPRPCRDDECDVKVILAFNPLTTRWGAYEAQDRVPWDQTSAGCFVIVNGQAWRPTHLVEDVRVRNELTEESAKDVVAGYPWHRPHYHPTNTQGEPS